MHSNLFCKKLKMSIRIIKYLSNNEHMSEERYERNSVCGWTIFLGSSSWLWAHTMTMMFLIREYCLESKTGFSVLSSHWKKLCSTNAIPNIGHDAYPILTHAIWSFNKTVLLQIYNSLCLKTWQNQNVFSINYSGTIPAAEVKVVSAFPLFCGSLCFRVLVLGYKNASWV